MPEALITDEIRASMRAIVDYDWNTEARDYAANPNPLHVFNHLRRVSAWLEGHASAS